MIKEEDINAVPEITDVSEIDKLTGMPKPNGKSNLTVVVHSKFLL